MIRYSVSQSDLEAAIRRIAPDWLEDAAARTERFRAASRYNEAQGSWSRIKDAYMAVQHNKCAYCERKLAGPPEGRIEHDVEHYRPKSAVRAWPTEAIRKRRDLTYRFDTGAPLSGGYYLLAYHPFNYATACKTCNSSFKAAYFPIAKTRGPVSDQPADFASEGAFIPYPLGQFDDDPERIITFEGILPIPKVKSRNSVRHRRARVTIDFFNLNLREELLEGRARVLDALWAFLELARLLPEGEERAYARNSVDLTTAPDAPHASCARAFLALYDRDRGLARRYAVEAQGYLATKQHNGVSYPLESEGGPSDGPP